MKNRKFTRVAIAAAVFAAAVFQMQGCSGRVNTKEGDISSESGEVQQGEAGSTEGQQGEDGKEGSAGSDGTASGQFSEESEPFSYPKESDEEKNTAEKEPEGISPIDGVKIAIGTDIHYLAEEYTDYGEAFQHMVDYGDGRLVTYIDQITDEFLQEVIEEEPEALIISGDITSNGEKRSHEVMAEKLRKVEETGITVLVIPGNHDINNHSAKGFQDNETYPVEYTSPEQFEEIYGEFGYDEAASRDENSLSYVYQLDENIRILMLDTCQYKDGYAKVGGAIMTETYDWIEEQMEDAWNNDMYVIPVAHHNLLDESEVYVADCTIEHSRQLIDILDGWEISLFLSGHLHVQHMMEEEGFTYPIREIVTGSLTTPRCHYGILTYQDNENYDYQAKQVNMERWARDNHSTIMDLLEFDAFGEPFLRRVFSNQADAVLKKIPEITEEERKKMCRFYAGLNDYYYQGKAIEIKDEALENEAFTLWQEKAYETVLNEYILYILEDAKQDYNCLYVREGETVYLTEN